MVGVDPTRRWRWLRSARVGNALTGTAVLAARTKVSNLWHGEPPEEAIDTMTFTQLEEVNYLSLHGEVSMIVGNVNGGEPEKEPELAAAVEDPIAPGGLIEGNPPRLRILWKRILECLEGVWSRVRFGWVGGLEAGNGRVAWWHHRTQLITTTGILENV